MREQVTVFLHFDQCSMVKEPRVLLSDVATVTSTNIPVKQKIEKTELFRFTGEKKEKKVLSVMKVIELLGTLFPEAEVTTLGEPDFIVEYKPEKDAWWIPVAEWGKTIAVALAVFFGSAFTIMTFNRDASVDEVFAMIYKF